MFAFLVATMIATPPTAAQAARWAKARDWDALYLGFAAVKPAQVVPQQRATIGKALLQACRGLELDDPALAASVAEVAQAFSPNANACLCGAMAAMRVNQLTTAEALLTAGRQLAPDDDRLVLQMARLRLAEGDSSAAASLVRGISTKSSVFKEAALLQAATPASNEVPPPPAVRWERGSGYQSSVDSEGRRVRANASFRFRYFNGQRDFGQRAEYEGRVQEALQRAKDAAQRLMGVTRQTACDVILYSREEFRLHHGAAYASAVAGFYSENAIRMNDSAELTAATQATLVHEYVHAVVDELTQFSHPAPIWLNEGLAEWVSWASEGRDGPPTPMRKRLRDLAQHHQLPPLTAFNRGSLVNTADPAVAYAMSAMAVGVLLKRRTMPEVVGFLKELGNGRPVETPFERTFGVDMVRFDEDVRGELSR